MRKSSFPAALLVLLSSHNLVFADTVPFNKVQVMETTPVIDGIIQPLEWPEQQMIRLSRAFHNDRAIRLYFAHDAKFLYVAAYAEDAQLWADGSGGGSGNIWDSADDDSIEWYFDLDSSGGKYLQANDRFLALNIGHPDSAITGSGVVSRRSFNQGTGDGGSAGVSDFYPQQLPDRIRYQVHHYGTVNQKDDIDTGYSIEAAIPWSLLPGAAHGNGDTMGLNTIIISDDTGGTRDLSDYRTIEPGSARFTTPIFADEYVELRHSAEHGSQSGLSGPDYYQVLQFHANEDTTPPDKVSNLVAGHPRPYSVRLQWNNPGNNGMQGIAAGFDVRYSTDPITQTNFNDATPWPIKRYPKPANATETIRVMGLKPSTTYYFGIRAFDETGNYGEIVTSNAITTQSVTELKSNIRPADYQGLIHVAPSGRYFMKENGTPFVPIGTHYLLQDVGIRYLYNDPVRSGDSCHNFAEDSGALKRVTDYMATLKASGINTMRLFLEDYSLNVLNNAAFNKANCAYWLEYPRGNYNPKMAELLINVLKLSSEYGIYVLINPIDTFFIDDYFTRTAWYSGNGGPIDNVDQFFTSIEAYQMVKDRWSFVINTIKNSGYADAVVGYEVLNEWDSPEWTISNPDNNVDNKQRSLFVESLAKHIRNLDDEHMVISSTTALDPRGALGNIIYYNDIFDAALPHFYFPSNREPWNNPANFKDTAVVEEQARAFSWWTLNQLNNKPILNGEWGPSDFWMPDPSKPDYFSKFQESDDEFLTRKLWLAELASGAAGPGIRMQGGVRGKSDFGLHLSSNMLATAKAISNFANDGINFTSFPSEPLLDQVKVTGTDAKLIVTGTSDNHQGMVYINQDKNKTNREVSGSILHIDKLSGGGHLQAEFWHINNNQSKADQIVEAASANLSTLNAADFTIPTFKDDWMIKFYEKYSAKLHTFRESGNQVIALNFQNFAKTNPVDVYFVYVYQGTTYSLIKIAPNQFRSVEGVSAFQTNVTPANGIEELMRLPATGNIEADVYIGTLSAGSPVSTLAFKTLQFNHLNF